MRTLTNRKTGDTVNTPMTNWEAAAKFAKMCQQDDSNWMWFWIHKSVLEHEAGTETRNAMQMIGDMFIVAIGYGLKRPMIRLHYRSQRFKIYLSGKGTICFKSGMLSAPSETGSRDPVGDEFYIGCTLNGRFLPAKDDYTRQVRQLREVEKDFFERLNANPIAFMAQCSKDMSRCCYCNQPLEDPRSKIVGYGETCAKHWGLPWGKTAYDEKAPSFARCYNDTAAGILSEIRANPYSEEAWMVFGDWLKEHGLPVCKKPDRQVQLPRS